jgi:DNA polymerase-3 subunit epsilon
VNEDLSLFGDDAARPAPVEPVDSPIADWQVDLLRKALNSRGLTTMDERQAAIGAAAGRHVESLRALSHDEGLQVLSRLGQATTSARADTSAWDDRDEDTWIDRL